MLARSLTVAASVGIATMAAGALTSAQAPARPRLSTGVLIGLHDPGSDPDPADKNAQPPNAGRLRTVWIRLFDSQTPPKSTELPNLLVPRRSGFWRMGLVGACEERKEVAGDGAVLGTATTVADYLWAVPVGRQPEVRLTDPELRLGRCVTRNLYCENNWRTSVYWVWPEYASLEMGTRVECGVHPDWTPGYTIRSLNDLAKPLTVGSVLGGVAENTFRKTFEGVDKHDEDCGDKAAFQPDSWYMERDDGGWKVIGWSDTHRLCGYGVDYSVDVDPFAVTGHRDDEARWRSLKRRLPQLVDAHFSPGGQWTLAATTTELIVFEGTATDRPAIRMAKPSDEHVIMVEWATGNSVARWDAEVLHLRNTEEPAPRLRQAH